jgi:hypothetical protein
MQIATSPPRRVDESIRQSASNRAEGKTFRALPDVPSPSLHRHAAAHGKFGHDQSEHPWESRKLIPLLVVWLAFYAIFVIGALIGIVVLPW